MMKKIALLIILAMFVAGTGLSAEPQPHMKAALAALQKAKSQLQSATADKGGHRVKAIQLVNQAIQQVRLGIAADNAK